MQMKDMDIGYCPIRDEYMAVKTNITISFNVSVPGRLMSTCEVQILLDVS